MFNYKKQLPGIDRSSDKNKMGRASSSALQMGTREYAAGPMPGTAAPKFMGNLMGGIGSLVKKVPQMGGLAGMAASKLGLFMKRGKGGCKCGTPGCKCQ